MRPGVNPRRAGVKNLQAHLRSSRAAAPYNRVMNPAANLILVGPTGAGKSCIGRRLAEHYGLRLVDADREIEQRTGANVATIFECEGEAGFRARERAVLVELLADDGMLLATGGGAVLDPDNRQLLRARGFVVHLQVSPGQQLARLARDKTRPLLQREDRDAVLHEMATLRAPLYAEVADLRFDTDGFVSADATAQLIAQLGRHWQRGVAA